MLNKFSLYIEYPFKINRNLVQPTKRKDFYNIQLNRKT